MVRTKIPGALVQLKRLESERQKFSRALKCPVPNSEKIVQSISGQLQVLPPPNNFFPACFWCQNEVIYGIMCLWIFEKSI